MAVCVCVCVCVRGCQPCCFDDRRCVYVDCGTLMAVKGNVRCPVCQKDTGFEGLTSFSFDAISKTVVCGEFRL